MHIYHASASAVSSRSFPSSPSHIAMVASSKSDDGIPQQAHTWLMDLLPDQRIRLHTLPLF